MTQDSPCEGYFSSGGSGDPGPSVAQQIADALNNPPRCGRKNGSSLGSILGKIFTLPNTIIGVTWGLINFGGGLARGTDPKIKFGNNAIQFRNSPFQINNREVTLGNVQIYGMPISETDDNGPGSSKDTYDGSGKINLGLHAEVHSFQAESLGPAYLIKTIAEGDYFTRTRIPLKRGPINMPRTMIIANSRSVIASIAMLLVAGCAPFRTVIYNDRDVDAAIQLSGPGKCGKFSAILEAHKNVNMTCSMDGISTVSFQFGSEPKCTLGIDELKRQVATHPSNQKGRKILFVHLSELRCPA